MTPSPTPAPQDQALYSVFTTSLAEILAQLQISLVVSTYQAGKVILVRYTGGDRTQADVARISAQIGAEDPRMAVQPSR